MSMRTGPVAGHSRPPALQVLALRVSDGDRVIGGGGERLEELERGLGFHGGGEQDLAEERGVDRAAAAEGEQEPARPQPAQGQTVHVLVGPRRGVEIGAAAGAGAPRSESPPKPPVWAK